MTCLVCLDFFRSPIPKQLLATEKLISTSKRRQSNVKVTFKRWKFLSRIEKWIVKIKFYYFVQRQFQSVNVFVWIKVWGIAKTLHDLSRESGLSLKVGRSRNETNNLKFYIFWFRYRKRASKSYLYLLVIQSWNWNSGNANMSALHV